MLLILQCWSKNGEMEINEIAPAIYHTLGNQDANTLRKKEETTKETRNDPNQNEIILDHNNQPEQGPDACIEEKNLRGVHTRI